MSILKASFDYWNKQTPKENPWEVEGNWSQSFWTLMEMLRICHLGCWEEADILLHFSLPGSPLQRVCPQCPLHHRVCVGHGHVLHADGLFRCPPDGEWAPSFPSTLKIVRLTPFSSSLFETKGEWTLLASNQKPQGWQALRVRGAWWSPHAVLWKTEDLYIWCHECIYFRHCWNCVLTESSHRHTCLDDPRCVLLSNFRDSPRQP